MVKINFKKGICGSQACFWTDSQSDWLAFSCAFLDSLSLPAAVTRTVIGSGNHGVSDLLLSNEYAGIVPIRGRAMVRLMEVKDSDSSRACQRSDGQPAEVRGNLGLWSGQLRFGPRQE